ncbi:MAG TPA: lysophospholipase [Desulfosporosinus sp.]|nr:lysophospholipase [Desulfosporosinus sp.]
MNNHNLSFHTDKGIRIYYHKQIPLNARGIVLISHGYGEHFGLYEEFMDFLTKNGYGVCAYDHRSQGRSEEPRGQIDKFELFIDDMAEVVKNLKQEYPDLLLFTFGHSMGGLIAFNYGILYPEDIRGQIFTGLAVGRPWGTKFIPGGLFTLLNRFFARVKIYPVLARKGSRNRAFCTTLKKDPYILRYITVGFVYEFIYRGISIAKDNAPNYQLSALFLHGKADKIIPYWVSAEIFKKISSEDKAIKLYEKLYHELVREPERKTVWQDVLEWLDQRGKIT